MRCCTRCHSDLYLIGHEVRPHFFGDFVVSREDLQIRESILPLNVGPIYFLLSTVLRSFPSVMPTLTRAFGN
jgi:hypothetical protein